jgi:hypothetical protein
MHYRRYRLHTLRGRVLNARFQIVSSYYFNYLLFFPIWLARQLIRICRLRLHSENELNTPTINSLLSLFFALTALPPDTFTRLLACPP